MICCYMDVIGPLTSSWSTTSFGIVGSATVRAAVASFYSFVLLGIHATPRHVLRHALIS